MNTQKYIVLRPEGTHEIKTTDGPATLEQLQEWVGGLIQPVRVRFHDSTGTFFVEALVDEEGLLKDLPRNRWFTSFVGPVVLVTTKKQNFYGVTGRRLTHMINHGQKLLAAQTN